MIPPGPKAWERLWDSIYVTEPDDCWMWVGSRYREEHPKFIYTIVGKRYRPTVRSLLFHELYGPIPDRTRVYNACNNRICMNPEHFFLAPQGFHLGRQMSGAFMSLEKAREMRWAKAKNPSFSYLKLGKMWEVSSATAYNICSNEIWCEHKWPYRDPVLMPNTLSDSMTSDERLHDSEDGLKTNST